MCRCGAIMSDDWVRDAFLAGSPLREVWCDLSLAERPAALRYWIDQAGHDAWAHVQLRDLGAALIASGMSPPVKLISNAEFGET